MLPHPVILSGAAGATKHLSKEKRDASSALGGFSMTREEECHHSELTFFNRFRI